MKTLKSLSVLTAAVLSNSLSLNAASDAANRPNFVIIFCDDMGYGDLSCYGNPTIRTPNIDRMACEGMKLTQFYVGAGVSTPSRAALMTGRLPVRNGLYGDRVAVLFPNSKAGLGQDEVTIAKVLQQSGYATGCVGKWHLGAFSPYLPTDHGFDTYFGIPYSNDMSPVQNKGAHARNFPPTPLILDGKEIESEPDQGELTRRYTEKAVSFIKDHSKEPFFLYFAHTFPHIPLYTNARFEGTSKRGLYGDVVEEIDWSVGEVLKALRENGLDENTFVIFTSDNGPHHEGGADPDFFKSYGPFRGIKRDVYEGGIRIPMVAWCPGTIKAGAQSDHISAFWDVMPTLAELTGTVLPEQTDGISFLPTLLSKKNQQAHDYLYWEFHELNGREALRSGKWKLIRQPIVGETILELYDLSNDIHEDTNLAEKYPDKVKELVSLMDNARTESPYFNFGREK